MFLRKTRDKFLRFLTCVFFRQSRLWKLSMAVTTVPNWMICEKKKWSPVLSWNREIPTVGSAVQVGNEAPRMVVLGFRFPCPKWTPMIDYSYTLCKTRCVRIPSITDNFHLNLYKNKTTKNLLQQTTILLCSSISASDSRIPIMGRKEWCIEVLCLICFVLF